MTEDEARLQAHLDANPGDSASRLVLADLLEERGEELAARAQRWLARLRKWPDSDLAFCGGKTGWHWWSRADEPHRKRDHAVLPRDVQAWMPRGEWLYPTRWEAEVVLARALTQAQLG